MALSVAFGLPFVVDLGIPDRILVVDELLLLLATAASAWLARRTAE